MLPRQVFLIGTRTHFRSAPLLVTSGRFVHSRSSTPRGRAGIKASAARRRSNPSSSSESLRQQRRQRQEEEAEQREREQEAARQEAAQQERDVAALEKFRSSWPSWLPRSPHQQRLEREEQLRSGKAPEGQGSQDPVDQVFISRDSPRHSSRADERPGQARESQQPSSDPDAPSRRPSLWSFVPSPGQSQQQQQQDRQWPSWLPPRPPPAPTHPAFDWLRQSYHQGRSHGWTTLLQDRRWQIVVVTLCFGGVWYVVHLERVPYTGRLRYRAMSDAQIAKTGEETLQQMISQYRSRILPADHPYSKVARRVALRILHAAEDLHGLDFESVDAGADKDLTSMEDPMSARAYVRSAKWQVYVIDDPQPNAFVLPGGQIFVFSGILPLCQTEDGLAGVLGHEVSHYLCRHIAEKASGQYLRTAFSWLLQIVTSVPVGVYGLEVLFGLPNSRVCEEEADDLGLKLMSRACYDPEAVPAVWERMDAMEKGKAGDGGWSTLSQLLSTHPMSSKRAQKMHSLIPQALAVRAAADCPEPGMVRRFTGMRMQDRIPQRRGPLGLTMQPDTMRAATSA